MLYFREREKARLRSFVENPSAKAMAIFGRRRTGKTELMLDYISGTGGSNAIYYQCTSFDYQACLEDFIHAVITQTEEDSILRSLRTFRDAFQYLSSSGKMAGKVFIIDEFPFLAKKDENTSVEFQWIIDHALRGIKLILLGSNLSFMRNQINHAEAPLYGRFDEILEIRPFSFQEVHALFPVFEDAVNVYAQTGGVAQYVMFFRNYSSVSSSTDALFLDRDGRLFYEAPNLLMQEVRETTTYISVLRAIGSSEKESGAIAQKCGMDPRNVFTYLRKLTDLEIVSAVQNPLDGKKTNQRYRIADTLFRFSYTFIEPNVSMITAVGNRSRAYILNDQYQEFLGIVYEDIIRTGLFGYAADGILPFMPRTVGKWWGNVQIEGKWAASEVDVIGYDDSRILIGECKYRNKAVGIHELDALKNKVQFMQTKGREVYYLLAGRSGFTPDLRGMKDDHLILLEKA